MFINKCEGVGYTLTASDKIWQNNHHLLLQDDYEQKINYNCKGKFY